MFIVRAPTEENLELPWERHGVGCRACTCRPYRAEGLHGYEAINILRLWRFGRSYTDEGYGRSVD